MKRLILIALILTPVTMAASCPGPTKEVPPDTVIDRHTPDELIKAGRKGPACWQLVIKHARTGQLEYLCVSDSVWRSHPVGSKAP